MGEFDESYSSESVDTSSDSSFDTSDVGDFDSSSEDDNSSFDAFEEDVSEAESDEQEVEAEEEYDPEYEEQEAEAEAEDIAEEVEADSSSRDVETGELLEQQGFDDNYAKDTETATDIDDNSSNDKDDSNYNSDKEYRVVYDGIEVDLSKDPLEGTKREIGHFEYEDAKLAADIQKSEAYYDAVQKAHVSAVAKSVGGAFAPFAGQAMKNDLKINKPLDTSVEEMAEYKQWTRASYTDDYDKDYDT